MFFISNPNWIEAPGWLTGLFAFRSPPDSKALKDK